MVKTPKMRHSGASREPLTIELDADAVSRIKADADTATEGAQTAPGTEDAATPSRIDGDEQTAAMSEPSGHDASGDAPAKSASAEREPAATTTPNRTRRDDSLSRVAAGAVGAVLALILAGLAQYVGLLGAPVSSGAASGVQAEIDGLKQQVAALQSSTTASELGLRVDTIVAALDTVKADLSALQQTVKADVAGGDEAGLQALDERIKAVETALANTTQGAAAAPADLAALAQTVAAVETALKAVGDRAVAGDARVAAMEQSIAALAAKIETQISQPKVALAIATAALNSAIERGAPFAAELETLAALAPDAQEIVELRPYATEGVPSLATLVAETGSAADAMIAAAAPMDPDAGFFDRLLHSAESLVTVRPIGAVEGTSVAAIVARIEVAITAGELATAIAEFDTLPDTVKAAAGPFAERLKARQAVEALADRAVAAAMKA